MKSEQGHLVQLPENPPRESMQEREGLDHQSHTLYPQPQAAQEQFDTYAIPPTLENTPEKKDKRGLRAKVIAGIAAIAVVSVGAAAYLGIRSGASAERSSQEKGSTSQDSTPQEENSEDYGGGEENEPPLKKEITLETFPFANEGDECIGVDKLKEKYPLPASLYDAEKDKYDFAAREAPFKEMTRVLNAFDSYDLDSDESNEALEEYRTPNYSDENVVYGLLAPAYVGELLLKDPNNMSESTDEWYRLVRENAAEKARNSYDSDYNPKYELNRVDAPVATLLPDGSTEIRAGMNVTYTGEVTTWWVIIDNSDGRYKIREVESMKAPV